ncbi:stage III sporulation protein AD [Lachnospiraceae bacterium MD1]|jgi:stage III sporulation protein AD|uniref:Stage III sporulation protein AD n=1 Tax=Variimorphobacter saccharofermentans TaxID=2755051 RepID=A0A839JYF4_9FIRM|nr:stage III sporulation AC/AD family protein [Variimorphobacter saccharofermentans]MBB2182384.1 stage III sporulation protein AD [Variimorphobacter saccharofermentans]
MVQIAVIGIIAITLAIIFKKGKEEYSLYISIAACFFILLWGISKLEVILDAINQLQGYIHINKAYVGILTKIIGITYVTEISSSLCKDSGYQAIAEQIELVGKLTILAISMPIMLALLETINSLLTVQ